MKTDPSTPSGTPSELGSETADPSKPPETWSTPSVAALLDELERKAKAATPGPWEVTEKHVLPSRGKPLTDKEYEDRADVGCKPPLRRLSDDRLQAGARFGLPLGARLVLIAKEGPRPYDQPRR